jgi:Leucine-rich repeat (LRR) protein
MSSMKDLKFDHNRLVDLPDFPKDFRKQIKTLSLIDNSINSISKNQLQGFDSLWKLQLGDNKIKEINEDIFQTLPTLYRLYMNHNPIRKSCSACI